MLLIVGEKSIPQDKHLTNKEYNLAKTDRKLLISCDLQFVVNERSRHRHLLGSQFVDAAGDSVIYIHGQ